MSTYKIVHNLISFLHNNIGLSFSSNKTRNARCKLEHKVQYSNIIASKYMHRLAPLWNSLPGELLIVNKLSTFKEQIRSWLKDIDFNFMD